MITIIILILVYFLSIIGSWLGFRLMSSKYTDMWLNEDCRFSLLWIIPIVNTLAAIIVLSIALSGLINIKIKTNYKGKKWLNTDL